MKVQPISDLHIDCLKEFNRPGIFGKIINPEADVLVFAGDMCEGANFDMLKKELSSVTKPILYVAGNHEHWGTEVYNFNLWFMHQMSYFPNVRVLQDDFAVIGDTVFIGGTMWTDLGNPIHENIVQVYMKGADLGHIKGFNTKMWNARHTNTVGYIEKCLKFDTWKHLKKIVVTHHGPSMKAVPTRYQYASENCAYHSNLDYILESDYAPDLWIHGHSHVFMDKKIGNTRVVRNPYGYKDYSEIDTGFNPGFMIDTEDLLNVTGLEAF